MQSLSNDLQPLPDYALICYRCEVCHTPVEGTTWDYPRTCSKRCSATLRKRRQRAKA